MRARAKRKLKRPEDPAAAAVWAQLTPDERDRARDAAVSAWVDEDPGPALVVADLQDQLLGRLIRGIAWLWIAVAAAGVALMIFAWQTGSTVTWPAFGGFAGALLSVTLQIWRLDRSRRANLRLARTGTP